MKDQKMKISELKPGQKVSINGMLAIYLGIRKVRIANFGKVEKIVFKAEGINIYRYYSFVEVSKTLKSEKIKLL